MFVNRKIYIVKVSQRFLSNNNVSCELKKVQLSCENNILWIATVKKRARSNFVSHFWVQIINHCETKSSGELNDSGYPAAV